MVFIIFVATGGLVDLLTGLADMQLTPDNILGICVTLFFVYVIVNAIPPHRS